MKYGIFYRAIAFTILSGNTLSSLAARPNLPPLETSTPDTSYLGNKKILYGWIAQAVGIAGALSSIYFYHKANELELTTDEESQKKRQEYQQTANALLIGSGLIFAIGTGSSLCGLYERDNLLYQIKKEQRASTPNAPQASPKTKTKKKAGSPQIAQSNTATEYQETVFDMANLLKTALQKEPIKKQRLIKKIAAAIAVKPPEEKIPLVHKVLAQSQQLALTYQPHPSYGLSDPDPLMPYAPKPITPIELPAQAEPLLITYESEAKAEGETTEQKKQTDAILEHEAATVIQHAFLMHRINNERAKVLEKIEVAKKSSNHQEPNAPSN